jgi:hypothetical protein
MIATTLVSCNTNKVIYSDKSNNVELEKMVAKDQEIRVKNISNYDEIDQQHRIRLMEMIADGKIKTDKDKLNAALILQHTSLTYCNEKLTSSSNENYLLAYMFAKNAFDNGSKEAAYYVAITYDRYLLYTKGYQKYGTQRIFSNNDEELWAPIDPTTTDEERLKYNVPVLKELLKKYKMQPFKD